jgi:hypothetical protein
MAWKRITLLITDEEHALLKSFSRDEGYLFGYWARKTLLKEAGIELKREGLHPGDGESSGPDLF